MNNDIFRLAKLSIPAKLLVTIFLAIIGPGYLFGTANIYYQHQYADDEPGLSLEDLRATFHGMTRTFEPDDKIIVNSVMLSEVQPDGSMREYLEEGGEPAVRALITWLENQAKEEEFAQSGLAQEGDPSAQEVIREHCIICHNADGGDMEDVPYAETDESDPDYALVMETATPDITVEDSGVQTKVYKPTSQPRLVHITHAHIFTMPMFTFFVGVLFLMTGISDKIKLLIGPLPMLAVLLDISSWWIARWVEPFIYVIAGAGAIFGFFYAIQILCIFGSLWFGRTGD